MQDLFIPTNPVELAGPFIGRFEEIAQTSISDFDVTEERELKLLEDLAVMYGFLNKYYQLSFKEPGDDTTEATSAYGEFKSYSVAVADSVFSRTSVRALCISLDKGLLVPDYHDITDEDFLHIPVRSIVSTDQIAAA